RASEEPGRLASHVLMADSVGAVAPDAMTARNLPVDRVGRGRVRKTGEERRVEDRDLGQVGEGRTRGTDAGERRRVVERRKGHELLDAGLDGVVHAGRP